MKTVSFTLLLSRISLDFCVKVIWQMTHVHRGKKERFLFHNVRREITQQMLMGKINTITKLPPYIKVTSMLFLKNSICVNPRLHETDKKKRSSMWHSSESPSNRAFIVWSMGVDNYRSVNESFPNSGSSNQLLVLGLTVHGSGESMCAGKHCSWPHWGREASEGDRKQVFFIEEIADHLHGRRKDETNRT